MPGDVIALEAGDLVPADCRLIEAFGVRVDNATVTGESTPLGRDASPCDEDDPLHSRNLVLAGTTLVAGEARALAYATGIHSEFGRIAHLSRTTGDGSFPLQQEIARLSRLVAALAAGLGVSFFAIGTAIGLPFWSNFLFAIGIIVANVPEGLLPTVTLALAIGARRMARRGVLIRHLAAVETLGSATVICTDKTGKLTESRMRVEACVLGGTVHRLTSAVPGELAVADRPLFEAALFCHDLKPGAGRRGAALPRRPDGGRPRRDGQGGGIPEVPDCPRLARDPLRLAATAWLTTVYIRSPRRGPSLLQQGGPGGPPALRSGAGRGWRSSRSRPAVVGPTPPWVGRSCPATGCVSWAWPHRPLGPGEGREALGERGRLLTGLVGPRRPAAPGDSGGHRAVPRGGDQGHHVTATTPDRRGRRPPRSAIAGESPAC